MSATKKRGVIALSDLPRWVKPIGVVDAYVKFSVFDRRADDMIDEYVFACTGMGVTLVAHAWHLPRRGALLVPTSTIPPLVMVAAGVIAATIEMTLHAQRNERGAV